MPWLPVVEREIRVAARQRATYRIRFWAVLIMLGLFAFTMLEDSNRGGNSSQAGRQLLEPLSLLSFLFAISIGAIATSDSVSEEKREGTLGLLFLTDLKGYDVILGKLVAHSINGFYALVAIMPILGMPLLMGGVTLLQFVKLILALVSAIVFSLAAGIFVSTRGRNERKAMFFTFLLLAAVTCGPFLLAFWLTTDPQRISEKQAWIFLMFSPGFADGMAFDTPSEWPAAAYWYGVGISWAGAILLLLDAAKTAPRSWAERAPKPVRSRVAGGGSSVPRTKTSRWMLDANPFFWLAMRGEASRARVWFFVLAVFAIWLMAWKQCGSIIWSYDVILPTAVILGVGLKIWVVGEASRRFVEDRRNNAMEFLLSTPLNERQIIRGQWQALIRQFLWPVVAVLLWETVMVFVMNNYRHWWDNTEFKLPLLLCSMFFLPVDMVALGWAGMMLGMTSKGRGRAMLTGLALIVVLPGVLTLIFMALLDHFGVLDPRGPRDEMELLPIIIFICASLMINLVVICLARSRLLSNFRHLALGVFR